MDITKAIELNITFKIRGTKGTCFNDCQMISKLPTVITAEK